MVHRKNNGLNCSLASALQRIGERWTIQIIREAFFGTRRFEDFQRHLGIARNILSARLRALCDNGILQRVPVKTGGKRHHYTLTDMGYDLFPTVVAITQWGDRWLFEKTGAPVRYLERATGEEIEDIVVQSRSGCQLSLREIRLAPGEGADEATRRRLLELEQRWQAAQQAQRKRIVLKAGL